MNNLSLMLMLLLLFSWPSASIGQVKKSYRVFHVVDGDTFDATDGQIKFRVRPVGMDTPESKQAFGQVATTELKNLIEGKEITIQPISRGMDHYNRVLGQVFIEGKDISLLMIKRGLASYYRPKCRDYPEDKQLYDYDPRSYVNAEQEARSAHLVIWADKSVTLPCQYKKEHRY